MSVFIATPVYRSDPQKAADWAYRAAQELHLDASSCFSMTRNFPWLHVAQAQLMAKFLWTSSCEYFFFREDDLFIEPDVLGRMLAMKADVAVTPYLIREDDRIDVMLDESGEVLWSGTGCCLVHRRVLDRLWHLHYEELNFKQNDLEVVALTRDMFVERDDGRQLLKGDHAFCLRVRMAGYRIQALRGAETVHAGQAYTWPLTMPVAMG